MILTFSAFWPARAYYSHEMVNPSRSCFVWWVKVPVVQFFPIYGFSFPLIATSLFHLNHLYFIRSDYRISAINLKNLVKLITVAHLLTYQMYGSQSIYAKPRHRAHLGSHGFFLDVIGHLDILLWAFLRIIQSPFNCYIQYLNA